jgi:uncharacterized protein
VAHASETLRVIPVEPNSSSSIRERAEAGRIPWTGPLLLVIARSFLLIFFQSAVAVLMLARQHPSPWREAGYWWPLYGTLVDLGCIAGMLWFTRREGIRMRDLIGPVRPRDVFLGLGYFAAVFPFFVGAGYLAQRLLYGPSGENPGSYLFHTHAMPLWATIYSLSLWWMIWSPAEETTYQAYVLPRLQALTGRTWVAFAVVGFFWTAQHCALPFVPNPRFLLFRFLAFLPGVLLMMGIYWRTRRLAPLIVAHWPMDIAAAIMTSMY